MPSRSFGPVPLGLIAAATLLASSPPVQARDYYVNGSAGSNSDCSFGQSNFPFQTIQFAANCSSPGDNIKIRAGTYRETVRPRGGSPGNPITYMPDPPGAVVEVSGADVITGWATYVDPGTGITYWRAPMPWSKGTGFDQVFISKPGHIGTGVMIPEARWPNDPDSDPLLTIVYDPPQSSAQQWAFVDASISPTQITDDALATVGPHPQTWNFNSYGNPQLWVNGGTLNYIGLTSTVRGWNGYNTFTFDPLGSTGAEFDPREGSIYYLFGTLPLLDASNEWVYRNGYLYLNHDPVAEGKTIEARRRDLAFSLDYVSYVTVKDIQVFSAGVITYSTPQFPAGHNTFDGVKARYITHAIAPQGVRYQSYFSSGIHLLGDHNTFRNGEIAFSSTHGIWVWGKDNAVVNNVIHDVGYVSEQVGGVYVAGERALVAYNTIYKSAYALIYLIHAKDSRIRNNDVWLGNLINDDAGAIYAVWTDSENTEIDHNLVHDFKGVGLGRNVNHGIYMDMGAHSLVVHHNVIWNIGSGAPPQADWRAANIYFGTPKNWALVYNNTLYASAHGLSVNYFDGSLPWAADFRQGRFVNNILRNGNQLPTSTSIGFLPVQRHNLPASQDPIFVNPNPNGWPIDLHIQCGVGSPAQDAGEVIPGVTDGAYGPPDLGAYECLGQPGTPSDPNWKAGCFGTPYCAPGAIPNPSFTPWNPTPFKNVLRASGFEIIPFLATTTVPAPWVVTSGVAQVYLGPQTHGGASGIENRRAGGINSLQLGPAATSVAQTFSGLSSSKLYEFSGWLRVIALGDSGRLDVSSGGTTWSQQVTWENGAPPNNCHDGLAPGCWKLVRVTFQPPAGQTTATVSVVKTAGAAPHPVFADDLGVAERPNLSIGGATQASSTYPGYSPAFVNDGHRSFDFFGWANDGVAPYPWVSVDLGVGATFDRADLYTTAGYEIRDYLLQAKVTGPCDGSGTWSDIASVSGNTAMYRFHLFPRLTAQCVRVLGLSGPNHQTNFVRVNELEVY